MAIGDDFIIDYVNRTIYHDPGEVTWYTVNELYSWLQDTFDELDQMDDPVPMSAQTPTDYTLINGWFLEENSYKFLRGGAIQTSGWDATLNNDGVRILTFVSGGYVNAETTDIGLQVGYSGGTPSDTGTLLAYDNTLRKWWVRVDDTGDTFANTGTAIDIDNGAGDGAGTLSVASGTGENLYSNLYTLGTIQQTTEEELIYIVQDGQTLDSWWPAATPHDPDNPRHIDVLIKVKEAGDEIDTGRLTIYLRHYPDDKEGDLYDHFSLDVSPGGRNAVPLATSDDINNTTNAADIASGVTACFIYFVNGTVEHDAPSGGGFTLWETVTWDSGNGSGIMLLDSSNIMTLGNISGTSIDISDTLTGVSSGATAEVTEAFDPAYTMNKNFDQEGSYPYSVIVNCGGHTIAEVYEYFKYVTRGGSDFLTYPSSTTSGGVTSHSAVDGEHYIMAHEDARSSEYRFSPVKASPFGTLAGGKLFGAQGVWLENMDSADIQAFQLIDSHGSTRTPPNKQNIVVTNLLEFDRVTVFRTNSTSDYTINKSLYTSHNTNNITGATTFEVTSSISTDTPTSGILRVVDNPTGEELRIPYASFSGSVFTLDGATLLTAYDSNDTAYVPYIDEEVGSHTETFTQASVTVTYVANRGLLIRVRRKTSTAILPFEATGTFGSTGFSIATIRTTDSIVDLV